MSLNVRLDSLTRKMDALILDQAMKAESQVQHDICSVCPSSMYNVIVFFFREPKGYERAS